MRNYRRMTRRRKSFFGIEVIMQEHKREKWYSGREKWFVGREVVLFGCELEIFCGGSFCLRKERNEERIRRRQLQVGSLRRQPEVSEQKASLIIFAWGLMYGHYEHFHFVFIGFPHLTSSILSIVWWVLLLHLLYFFLSFSGFSISSPKWLGYGLLSLSLMFD